MSPNTVFLYALSQTEESGRIKAPNSLFLWRYFLSLFSPNYKLQIVCSSYPNSFCNEALIFGRISTLQTLSRHITP